jgi:hypothetical protein
MTRFWARTSPRSNPLKLAFAEPMHGFIALDGPLGGVERPKSQARIHTTLRKPMVLFNGPSESEAVTSGNGVLKLLLSQGFL